MTLSNRALIVILPVVIVSYCVAALIAFATLERVTVRHEQKSLDLATQELASSFNQYAIFTESYLLALTESSSFQKLVSEKQAGVYDNIALNTAIEHNIRSFKQHHANTLTFLVSSPASVLYFFELSEDPFSEPDPAVLSIAYQSLRDVNFESLDFIEGKDTGAIIVMTRLLDRRSLKPPISADTSFTIAVQFSLEPTGFIKLKRELESFYGGRVFIAKNLPSDDAKLMSYTPIGKDYLLSVQVPDRYLEGKIHYIAYALLLVSSVFVLVSSVLLYHFLRKNVTQPIEELEKDLSRVVHGEKESIELRSQSNCELGRLERTFNQLYGDLSESYQQTRELAEKDRLTKLYNVSYISGHTVRMLSEAKKHKQRVAFIYVDMDNFKFVNDKYGHSLGDDLLKTFASRLSSLLHYKEQEYFDDETELLFGRIAGDEFAVIIRNVLGEEATLISHSILHLFKDGFHFEKGTFPVTASIGISIYPDDGHTLSQLMSNADSAMYSAKSNGKNQLAYYSKEIAFQERRLREIEQELKSCNFSDEFYLVYMPLVDAVSEDIVGFETLLRWTSKKLGFIGPDEFIPVAESCGLFEKVDYWVLNQAFSEYHRLKERLGHDFKLSVNLSSAQLKINGILRELMNLCARYEVEPKYVQLEMTETLNIEYTKEAHLLLQTLVKEGFNIAIDDFGTGYTALLQLIEYPAQMIKFDKTFIEKSMRPENRQMLRPLISLCHSQNLKITAEGVETAEIAHYLRDMGCDYLQGYVYGKPARLEELSLPGEQTLE